MGEVTTAIEEARASLDAASSEFMTDLCDVSTVSETPDGYGGTTETPNTIASDVPCSYKPMSQPLERQFGGAALVTLTHLITMGSNAITKQIRPDYKIVVHAHDDVPEMTFENPVAMNSSTSPFVKLAAALSL